MKGRIACAAASGTRIIGPVVERPSQPKRKGRPPPSPLYHLCPSVRAGSRWRASNVVTSSQDVRILQPMRWGLVPYWWSKPLKELPARDLQRTRRDRHHEAVLPRAVQDVRCCLIPASGYYEWHDTPDGKQPYYFTRADGEAVTIAGAMGSPGFRDKASGKT